LLFGTQEQAPALHIIAAALADLTIVNQKSEIKDEHDSYSPWKTMNGFRN